MFEGETSDRVTLLDKVVDVDLPGGGRGRVVFDFEKNPPRPGRPRRFPLKGTEATVVAEDFQPHVRTVEGFQEGTEGPSALRFVLEGPFGKQESWLVAGDAERHSVDFGPASFDFHTADAVETHDTDGKNHVAFVLQPGGALTYTLTAAKHPAQQGALAVGKVLETPWMGMKVTVDKLFLHAETDRQVVPETPPQDDEQRQPAVLLHLEAPTGKTESVWVAWATAVRVPFAGRSAAIAYHAPELSPPLPFRVTLLDFNSEKYPGSNMAATYESFVRVDDPENGPSEHHISMNHPLHYRGYIFFQASFVEGQPMMSIFSVARAPGLLLVYIGCTLITLGVVWMFYIKPYLARRQAAQALKAHREREARHESESSVPEASSDPSARRPAQPAGSGA